MARANGWHSNAIPPSNPASIAVSGRWRHGREYRAIAAYPKAAAMMSYRARWLE